MWLEVLLQQLDLLFKDQMQRFFICWSKRLHVCLYYKQINLSIEKDHKNNEFVDKNVLKCALDDCLHVASDDVIPGKTNDDDDQLT